jgi:hypothetical protein
MSSLFDRIRQRREEPDGGASAEPPAPAEASPDASAQPPSAGDAGASGGAEVDPPTAVHRRDDGEEPTAVHRTERPRAPWESAEISEDRQERISEVTPAPAAPAAAPAPTPTPSPAAAEPPRPVAPAEAPPVPVVPARPGVRDRGRMRRRLRYLRRVRELGYRDLGGLVFELRRANQRNEVLVSAKHDALARIDDELRALEHALQDFQPIEELYEPGVSVCLRCGALHGSDARFCPQCGVAVGPAAAHPGPGAPGGGPATAAAGSVPPSATPADAPPSSA